MFPKTPTMIWSLNKLIQGIYFPLGRRCKELKKDINGRREEIDHDLWTFSFRVKKALVSKRNSKSKV